MAQIVNHKIDGQAFDPIREAKGLKISIIAGLDNQPVTNITSASFTNTENSNSSTRVRELVAATPTEGFDYSFEVTDGTDSLLFEFYADISRYVEVSDVETKIGLVKDKALESLLDFEGADITMTLLEFKNILNNVDYENIPYVTQNRKSDLEKIQLLAQFFIVIKTGIDEVFKIVNIAADIPTLGAPIAALNLTTTLVSLILLISNLVSLIEEMRETFFPLLRYHSGIKLKTFLTKAVNYLNYDIEFGNVWEELDNIVLCPSKNDEIGVPVALPFVVTSGILNPGDFGHNLADAFELCRMMANVRVGIIGNVVHVRPKKDPFWLLNSGYIMPSVKIEESPFTNNGTKRLNFEESFSSTTIQYQTDDSDYWTIQKLAEGDANGDRISVTTVTPITVGNQRKVNIGGAKVVDIPYALCIRKDVIDDLLDQMIPLGGAFDTIKDDIANEFQDIIDSFTVAFPALEPLSAFIFNRNGAMKVENHFFSTPKMVYLAEDGKIPKDFNTRIGAKAIYNKYFAYDSLVPGVRNPLDASDTNAKKIFEAVKIPFTLKDAKNVINNLYFSTEDGDVGRFIKIDWDVDSDSAVVDFWIQDNWLTNVEENQI